MSQDVDAETIKQNSADEMEENRGKTPLRLLSLTDLELPKQHILLSEEGDKYIDNELEVPKINKSTGKGTARTPSGNIISGVVGETRKLFSPKRAISPSTCPWTSSHARVDRATSSSDLNVLDSLKLTSHFVTPQRIPNKSAIHDKSVNKAKKLSEQGAKRKIDSNHTSNKSSAFDLYNYLKAERTKSCEKMKGDKDNTSKKAHDDAIAMEISTSPPDLQGPTKKYKKDSEGDEETTVCDSQLINVQDLDRLKEIVQTTPEEELPVMNVKTVIEMFEKINGRMENIQKEQAKKMDEACKASVAKHIDSDLQTTFTHYDKEIDAVKQDLAEVKKKNKLMNEVMQYNQCIVEDLASRLDSVEMGNARKSAVLTGFHASYKKNILIQQIKDLFENTLQVNIYIEDAYQLGDRNPKPIVVIFNSAEGQGKGFLLINTCLIDLLTMMEISSSLMTTCQRR